MKSNGEDGWVERLAIGTVFIAAPVCLVGFAIFGLIQQHRREAAIPTVTMTPGKDYHTERTIKDMGDRKVLLRTTYRWRSVWSPPKLIRSRSLTATRHTTSSR